MVKLSARELYKLKGQSPHEKVISYDLYEKQT